MLYHEGIIEAQAYQQNPVFEAAIQFAGLEDVLAAPETAHAIKSAIDEALRCKQERRSETILFNLSGHGYFDMSAYDDFRAKKLLDYELTSSEIEKTLTGLPDVG